MDSPLHSKPLPSQLHNSGLLLDVFPADEDSDVASWSDDESPLHPDLAHFLTHDNPHFSTGHTPPRRLSDTCPHTCVIYNQNVNGMGFRDDKPKRIIEMTIDRQTHGYFLQETWQLGTYCKTIRGHTVFHHGVNDRPSDQLGRNTAGVMIILGPDLTRA